MLFLSADLVGSTHYKQAQKSGWQNVFLTFYHDFPQTVESAVSQANLDHGLALEPSLWKAIGDELVYEVPVSSEKEVYVAVRAWIVALREYEERLLNESKLTLKGGAFIATFPGPDSRSTIPITLEKEKSDKSVVLLNDEILRKKKTPTKYIYDYFGPSIDTGFRVFSRATDRHFTLSLEVAWCMAIESQYNQHNGNKEYFNCVDLTYLGAVPFKGVWNGRDYPLFAIDGHSTDAVNEALKQLTNSSVDHDNVMSVANACYESDPWPTKLYLPQAREELFHNLPEDAMAELRAAADDRKGVESQDESAGEPLPEETPLE